MISNYDLAKEMVNIVDVAQNLGVIVNRNRKALCPFHNDVKTPSLHLWANNTFKCFACGEQGDAVSFVSRKLNFEPHEALSWLNITYNLGLNLDEEIDSQLLQQANMEQEHKRDIRKLVDLAAKRYSEYFRLLREWRVKYTPLSMEEEPDWRFQFSLANIGYIEYICDAVFIEGSYEERRKYVLRHKKQLAKIIQILKDGDRTEKKEQTA